MVSTVSEPNDVRTNVLHIKAPRGTEPVLILVGTGEVTLKEKHFWLALHADDAVNLYMSYKVGTSGVIRDESDGIGNSEFAKVVECSVIRYRV